MENEFAKAEKVVRRLKGLERSINALLDDNMAGSSTRELINKMRDGIDDLPLNTDAEAMNGWQDKVTGFEKRFGALQAAQTQQQQPPPPSPQMVAAEPKEKAHLPKEKPVEHDGRVESFRPFLLRFNILVGEADVEETVKFRHLCSAVFPDDLNSIVELSYEKAY